MNSIFKLSIIGILLTIIFGLPLKAQDFTRGFATEEKLLRGAIVSRIEGDDERVEGSNQGSIDRLYGVVVRSNETAVSLTVDTSGVLVANSGRFEMLVSNINGEIEEGDYVTASPIKGIAMKADDRQPKTIGQSLQNFEANKSDQILTTRQIKADDGQVKTVAIGRILVDLDVRNNPLAYGVQAPQVLIQLGETIAGGPVSVTRIWGALAVIFLSFATGSIIFYAGIRTSIISIGRNPLSKSSVLRGFMQITMISLSIFIIGGFAVYLILKL